MGDVEKEILKIRIQETENLLSRYKAMKTYNNKVRKWIILTGMTQITEKLDELNRILEEIVEDIIIHLNELKQEYREIKKQL